MFQKLLPYLLILSAPAFAQNMDLANHFSVIKELIPGCTKVGLLYNPSHPNVEDMIALASQNTGLVVVKAPVASMRDMANAVRSLAKYNVSFIYMLDDKTVTGAQTIKFAVKQTMRDKIPIFTSSENAFEGGAYGWLINAGAVWNIKINASIRDKFDVVVPESSKFIIEE